MIDPFEIIDDDKHEMVTVKSIFNIYLTVFILLCLHTINKKTACFKGGLSNITSELFFQIIFCIFFNSFLNIGNISFAKFLANDVFV